MTIEVSKYLLLSDTTAEGLSTSVNAALAKGWELYGSAQPCGIAGSAVYTQTMVLKAYVLAAKDKTVLDCLDSVGDGSALRGWIPLEVWKEKADAKFVYPTSFRASVKSLVEQGYVLDNECGKYRINPNKGEDLI